MSENKEHKYDALVALARQTYTEQEAQDACLLVCTDGDYLGVHATEGAEGKLGAALLTVLRRSPELADIVIQAAGAVLNERVAQGIADKVKAPETGGKRAKKAS